MSKGLPPVRVKYVGRKATAVDNICGTGVIWAGHGDVQLIPLLAAEKLATYPDVWKILDDDDNGVVTDDSGAALDALRALGGDMEAKVPDADMTAAGDAVAALAAGPAKIAMPKKPHKKVAPPDDFKD